MAPPRLHLSRRRLLQGAGAAGLVAVRPALAAAPWSDPAATLLVYDSRIAESAALAAASPHRLRHDLAQGRIEPGRLRAVAALEGLTRRSDLVALSLGLRLHGLRVVEERRSAAPLSGRDHLYRWSMARPRAIGA